MSSWPLSSRPRPRRSPARTRLPGAYEWLDRRAFGAADGLGDADLAPLAVGRTVAAGDGLLDVVLSFLPAARWGAWSGPPPRYGVWAIVRVHRRRTRRRARPLLGRARAPRAERHRARRIVQPGRAPGALTPRGPRRPVVGDQEPQCGRRGFRTTSRRGACGRSPATTGFRPALASTPSASSARRRRRSSSPTPRLAASAAAGPAARSRTAWRRGEAAVAR